jgi:hypothetical protein
MLNSNSNEIYIVKNCCTGPSGPSILSTPLPSHSPQFLTTVFLSLIILISLYNTSVHFSASFMVPTTSYLQVVCSRTVWSYLQNNFSWCRFLVFCTYFSSHNRPFLESLVFQSIIYGLLWSLSRVPFADLTCEISFCALPRFSSSNNSSDVQM